MTTTAGLHIDDALLAEAERFGLDVKVLVEAELRRRIESAKRARIWQTENRAAIDAANRELEQNGLWYENLRR
jgi:post-segregation antitoxin (ccd killing protein)